MKRMLIQTQLSNYDTNGKFILECDSGWQMMMGRVRVMLELVPDLHIDIMGPNDHTCLENQVITSPFELNSDLFLTYDDRLRYLPHRIIPNALATRYDFDFEGLARTLFADGTKYDYVYVNDPMLLRSFRALFFIKGKHLPKFFVHSHFIDDPDCPKFPTEASLWMGQCEAARKSDFNFWQCESSMNIFFDQMSKEYLPHVVQGVKDKSRPWDDGYSSQEIQTSINFDNVRFDHVAFLTQMSDSRKKIIFVPNRIGGMGRSSDYTNCGKFMFELLPKLAQLRTGKGYAHDTDFVIVCGNPSQKIFNNELEELCGKHGYVNLVPDAFNRDEFKLIARSAHIAVGLYNQDSYGGTVARECIELGCLPFWVDNYEYKTIASEAGWCYNAKPDLSNVPEALDRLLTDLDRHDLSNELARLQKTVRGRCSYEWTTEPALKAMGII